MNNFSPLPASASDSRLSRSEMTAPNVVSPLLLARQHKLRRLVASVVGGATLLMCVGLLSAAIRSYSERTPDAPTSPVAPAPAASLSPAPVAQPDPSPEPAAAPATSARAATLAVGQKKATHKAGTGFSHPGKTKRSTSKTVIVRR